MAANDLLLRAESLGLTFGGKPLFEDISFSVHAGNRIALVGRNGSGKSTLLKIVAGLVEPSSGEVTSERSVTVRYLPQAPDFKPGQTLEDYTLADLGPLDEPHHALALLEELGLDPARTGDGLSGGEARRAALARTLAPRPDILLLDEPTNHLDLPVIEWLENTLLRMRSALVVISHDRRFLETVSGKTLWLDRGNLFERDAGFAGFEDWRDKLLEEEERDLHKLKRKIVREEHWVTHGVSGRRKRNMRRLGELQGLRTRFAEHERAPGGAKLETADSPASGKLVIEAVGLGKTMGERTIVEQFSTRIHRGDRIGFVGPNGAGKTTLIRLLTGHLEADAGTIRHGANLEQAMLDQRRDALKPDESLEDFLTDGRGQTLVVNGIQKHVASYMKDFLFKPEQARTPVRELSGGEKARLVLAKLLARPANLLILDEPTNDLDMETLDLLQEMINEFDGTLLLVSHDRDFLDRTVNAVVAPDPDRTGRWLTYAGGYSDMQAQRQETARAKSASGSGKTVKPATQKETKPKSAGKLSYKDKFALETLPGEIEALEGEISRLASELSDPNLFTRDPARFDTASRLLTEKQAEREAKEERWLELEMAREALED